MPKRKTISSKDKENSSSSSNLKRKSRQKRKSSFGDLIQSIHPSIAPSEFHTSVSTELPDPTRLKQILIYSIQSEISEGNTETKEANEVVKVILQDLIDELLKGGINCSWYTRKREGEEKREVKVNPANVELGHRIVGYENVLKKLKREEKLWKKVGCEFIEKEKAKLECWLGDVDCFDGLFEEKEAKDFLQEILRENKGSDEQALELKENYEDKIYELCEKIHQTHVSSRELQSFVSDRFPKVVDCCWNNTILIGDENELESVVYPLRSKRRLSIPTTCKELPMPKDTVDLLRALSSATKK